MFTKSFVSPFVLSFFLCFLFENVNAQNTEISNSAEIIQQEKYSFFSDLINKAEMNAVLAEDSFFICAPTNEAFDALPKKSILRLTDPQNKKELGRILSNHIFPLETETAFKELKKGEKVHIKAINGAEIIITKSDVSTIIEDEKGRVCEVVEELEGVLGISGLLNLFETR